MSKIYVYMLSIIASLFLAGCNVGSDDDSALGDDSSNLSEQAAICKGTYSGVWMVDGKSSGNVTVSVGQVVNFSQLPYQEILNSLIPSIYQTNELPSFTYKNYSVGYFVTGYTDKTIYLDIIPADCKFDIIVGDLTRKINVKWAEQSSVGVYDKIRKTLTVILPISELQLEGEKPIVFDKEFTVRFETTEKII